MAERDSVIKRGQITIPRLIFLALVGGFVVFTVSQGGKFLAIGYWLLTLAICGILLLIAIDYGITMEKVELHPGQAPEPQVPVQNSTQARLEKPVAETRAKRKPGRPAKRRR
ncbi:MAG TPA: hypothetical protein VKM94_14815 [Blastocatellia bacterium]|nr:hypothetical protein [Blastocatellia bacterium]